MNNSNLEGYEEIYKTRCHELSECGCALEELNKYSNFKDLMSEEVFKEIKRLIQNRKNKRYRTKEKFKQILLLQESLKVKSYIVFGTITIRDEYLVMQERTYTKKINNWIRKHFLYAIVNIDYGKKNERPHFHFIGLTCEWLEPRLKADGEPLKSKSGYDIYELVKKDYSLGFEPTLNIINLKKDDINKTVSYLLKLNNHSSKETAHRRVRILRSCLMRLVELR